MVCFGYIIVNTHIKMMMMMIMMMIIIIIIIIIIRYCNL